MVPQLWKYHWIRRRPHRWRVIRRTVGVDFGSRECRFWNCRRYLWKYKLHSHGRPVSCGQRWLFEYESSPKLSFSAQVDIYEPFFLWKGLARVFPGPLITSGIFAASTTGFWTLINWSRSMVWPSSTSEGWISRRLPMVVSLSCLHVRMPSFSYR